MYSYKQVEIEKNSSMWMTAPRRYSSIHFWEFQDYGDRFGAAGDIITVSLDLCEYETGQNYGTLSFAKNGKDFGVAFDTLSLDVVYRLAVCLFTTDNSVTILSYETTRK